MSLSTRGERTCFSSCLILKMYLCQLCGLSYDWGMYFNNHMRSKHGRTVKTVKRKIIGEEGRKLLEDYYLDHKWPNLNDIKILSKMAGVTKETVYWWFRNRRQKHSQDVRIKQEKSSHRISRERTTEEVTSPPTKRQRLSDQHGSNQRPHDRIFDSTTKGGKIRKQTVKGKSK